MGTAADKTDLDNRARLLHAAADAFALYGYEGVSLREIAETAGVSFQLITYHFGTKEGLWKATVEFLCERYFETGKGLGFTLSGDVYEQFHNHLRLLLTDMLQRPQLRKVWIQEHLAQSDRYTETIKPQIRELCERLSTPYFNEVVRLGVVTEFTAQEVALLWAAIVQLNLVYPYYVELLLGEPTGSPKSIERQVDLVYSIVTAGAKPLATVAAGPKETRETGWAPQSFDETTRPGAESDAPAAQHAAEPNGARQRQLELENERLKRLVGSLTLEKSILLEMLEERGLEPGNEDSDSS